MVRSVAILCLLASLPLTAQQTSPFGEKVDVNVVLVDAIVTDADGHQILGLDKDDFIVTENGKPQKVESVDYFTNRTLLNGTEKNAVFKVERVREERYFVFFFDKPEGALLYDRLRLARDAARKFIDDEMLPADRVAIVGHDVRLKVYSDFTNDKAQLHKALDSALSFGPGLTKSGNAAHSILGAVDGKAMINRTGTVYEALTVLGDSLRAVKARKNLILFSPGIVEQGEDVRDGVILSHSRYYRPMVQSLNAANVTVYSVNLQADAPLLPVYHDTLQSIATDTNGEYFRNSVSFYSPVAQVEQTNNGYYLLTYYTQKPKGTKGYQKVAVTLKNREFKVKAREGYVYGE